MSRLTDTQIANINSLPMEMLFEIAQLCNEALGVVSLAEYAKIMNIPLRTVYFIIKNNSIRHLDGMPCVNLNNN